MWSWSRGNSDGGTVTIHVEEVETKYLVNEGACSQYNDSMARRGGKNNSLKQPKEEVNIKYMHKPPTIQPNYGNQKRSGYLPKSKVSRVLLYDNATQDHMLDIKLANIKIERERITRLLNLHKRSFSTRQMKKKQLMKTLSAENMALITASGNASARNKTENKSARTSKSSPPIEVNKDSIKQSNDITNETTPDKTDDVKEVTKEDEVAISLEGLKLPNIDVEQRHVIFKVKDQEGNMQVYHTVDEEGMFKDLIPMHTFYPKMTDDPRFRGLEESLVPVYTGSSVS